MTERNIEVGTKGGLSQRWREESVEFEKIGSTCTHILDGCADALDAAKLRIEEAVKALQAVLVTSQYSPTDPLISREAVLKIIREIL